MRLLKSMAAAVAEKLDFVEGDVWLDDAFGAEERGDDHLGFL